MSFHKPVPRPGTPPSKHSKTFFDKFVWQLFILAAIAVTEWSKHRRSLGFQFAMILKYITAPSFFRKPFALFFGLSDKLKRSDNLHRADVLQAAKTRSFMLWFFFYRKLCGLGREFFDEFLVFKKFLSLAAI